MSYNLIIDMNRELSLDMPCLTSEIVAAGSF